MWVWEALIHNLNRWEFLLRNNSPLLCSMVVFPLCHGAHHKKPHSPTHPLPMLKIRQLWDRLIFTMGIPILVKRHLYIETAPWYLFILQSQYYGCWCPGSLHHQGINSQGVALDIPEYNGWKAPRGLPYQSLKVPTFCRKYLKVSFLRWIFQNITTNTSEMFFYSLSPWRFKCNISKLFFFKLFDSVS